MNTLPDFEPGDLCVVDGRVKVFCGWWQWRPGDAVYAQVTGLGTSEWAAHSGGTYRVHELFRPTEEQLIKERLAEERRIAQAQRRHDLAIARLTAATPDAPALADPKGSAPDDN